MASLARVRVTASARTKTYAVVIAQNRSLDPGVKPLQYADDDGAKNWELLSLFADRASLFVVLDDDTARLHPDAARIAESPERAAIFDRLARFNAEMAARSRARRRARALLHLRRPRRRRRQRPGLHQPARRQADARRALSRRHRAVEGALRPRHRRRLQELLHGQRARRQQALGRRLGRRPTRAPPATRSCRRSSRRSSSSAIRAPASSSPPRAIKRRTSGRAIAAASCRTSCARRSPAPPTSTATGAIEYSELRAFLAAANARVRNPEARVDVFARAPALDRHRPLVDLRDRRRPHARFLHFGAGLGGRFFIEDDRGVRVADFNKEPGAAFDVMVSARHAYYVCRSATRSKRRRRASASGASRWRRCRGTRAPSPRAARSTPRFRNDLYREPYGRGFYDGFVATRAICPSRRARRSCVATGARPRASRAIACRSRYMLSGAPTGDTGLNQRRRPALRLPLLALARPRRRRRRSATAPARAGRRCGAPPRWSRSAPSSARSAGSACASTPRIGWQLSRAPSQLGGQRLTGTEPRGLRYELAGGINVNLAETFCLFARGGLALDGVYPQGAHVGSVAQRIPQCRRAVLTLIKKTAHSR